MTFIYPATTRRPIQSGPTHTPPWWTQPGIAAQPFWLWWTTSQGKARSHAPDYFARCADGGARVLDCRLAERIKPRDAEAFAATRAACELVGWRYGVVGSPDPITMMNVRWLSGYHHPRHDVPAVAGALQAAFVAPTTLMAGAESVGDPIAVLPVLFHLLWRQRLRADLSAPLSPDTTVVSVGASTTVGSR